MRKYQKSEFILLILDGVWGLFLIETFLKNSDPPLLCFQMSQIEIETFLFFFTPPPPIRTLSQRGYLVSKLIMHGWHFHFLFMAVSNIFLGLHVGISIINLFTRYPLLPFFLVTSPLTLVSCIPSKGLNYEAYNLTLINATYFQN